MVGKKMTKHNKAAEAEAMFKPVEEAPLRNRIFLKMKSIYIIHIVKISMAEWRQRQKWVPLNAGTANSWIWGHEFTSRRKPDGSSSQQND